VELAGLRSLRVLLASDFLQKVAETFATRVVLLVVGLFTSIIVTRALGPSGRGLYGVALAVSGIGIQLTNLGLHASNTYLVAQNRSLLGTLIANSVFISFVPIGFGVGLVYLAFQILPHIAPLHETLLFLALAWIPLGLAYMLGQNLLLGIQEVRAYNQIEILLRLVAVVLTGLIILGGRVSPENIFSVSLITACLGLILVLRHLKSSHPFRLSLSYRLFKDNILYGFRAYIAAFLPFLVLRVDLLIVESIKGSTQAGYYSLAATLTDMLYLLPATVGAILFPKLSAMQSVREKWDFAKKVSFGVWGAMLPIIGTALLLVSPAIRIMYGARFLAAVPSSRILFVAIFFYAANTVLNLFLASLGYPTWTLVIWSGGVVMNVVLNLLFVPSFGIQGAAWNSLLTYASVYLCHVALIPRKVLRFIE
jgi:O-antigen/teichoic acid export membrane protein